MRIKKLLNEQGWNIVQVGEDAWVLYTEMDKSLDSYNGVCNHKQLWLEYMCLIGIIDLDELDAMCK